MVTAILQGGEKVVARATINGGVSACIGCAIFGGNIYNSSLQEAKLTGQSPRCQRHAVGKACHKRLAKHAQALGQLHAVQTKLHLIMVATHMNLTITVLSYTGRLQQHLIQRSVITPWNGFNGLTAESVNSRARVRLQIRTGLIQMSRYRYPFRMVGKPWLDLYRFTPR